MRVDELEGVATAPDELDAVTANETTEQESEKTEAEETEAEEVEATDDEATDEGATAQEATDDEPAEEEAKAEESDDDAEPKETKSQRKRRLRREREERLREEAMRLQREKEALEKRLSALEETDPNAAEDYDAAVQQNAVKGVLREADKPRLDALKADLERAEEERQKARADAWQERVAEVEHIKDFNDRVYDPSVPFTPEIVEAVQELDAGPQVAYHLATNREELLRLQNMSPVQLGAALGRLEAKVSYPEPKRKSSAPKPLKTLKGSDTESEPNLETADYETYRKLRGLA